MNKTGGWRIRDERLYNRATFLAMFAIVVYAIYHCINLALEGWTNRIWTVLAGCLAALLVIVLFRRARGILNPAFTVPFTIYIVYIIGSIINTRYSGFFTIFFCICGLAMMYLDPWRFLLFITLANTISMILILTGASMAMSQADQFVNWIFAVFGSLFLFLTVQFISEKIKKSVRAEDSFGTLLSSTPDHIVLVDEKNCVSYISKPLAEFAHIEDPKMAIGRPLLDIFREMDLKLKAAEILDSQGFYEGTWELSQDGEIRYFRIISNHLLGESAGLFISLMDITSLVKARSEAEAADRAKSVFLANTSHEIRTPMNAILGMSELILRKNIPPDLRNDVTSIKQAGTNLITIINDVLDFSKIESGKLEIIPVEYHFASMISDVINIISMRLIEKQLDFITYIDGSLPSVLIGDETRVRQVLLNILSNAVKYTKEGEISLRIFSIETRSEEDLLPGVVLVFEIADTGIGIREENLKKLFGEFQQFDIRANRGVEGTGLGLAISRNLCRLMGGDITAKSEYGKGSVFRAIIPQDVKDNSPFAKVKNPEEKVVLIYENREKRALSLAYAAGKLGVSHHLAGSKEEFLDLAKTGHYPYILVSLPLFIEVQKGQFPLFGEGALKEGSTKLAVITDYTYTEPQTESLPDCQLFSMPVHPSTLARFLNDEEGLAPDNNDSPANFTAPKARLLIVDDIATNLKVAEGLLEPYLATVDICLNGEEAIEMVKKQKYDIIFMDHMMPIMNGIEAAAAIRALENAQREKGLGFPGETRIPIVALTANVISGMKEMFLEKGFDDFLAKPIEVNKLDEILRKWIPKEKREKREGENEKIEKNVNASLLPSNFTLLADIPGLDVNKGITMTGGNPGNYFQVLSLFRKDAVERLPILNKLMAENADAKNDDGDGFDFMTLTTQVHALKSASAALGASTVSVEAAHLEAAGKAKDSVYIRQSLPGFNASLSRLVEAIAQVTSKDSSRDAANAELTAFLPALHELKKALAGQKLGAIDNILEDLKQKTAGLKIQETVEIISDQVLLAEFDEAIKSLDLLIKDTSTQVGEETS